MPNLYQRIHPFCEEDADEMRNLYQRTPPFCVEDAAIIDEAQKNAENHSEYLSLLAHLGISLKTAQQLGFGYRFEDAERARHYLIIPCAEDHFAFLAFHKADNDGTDANHCGSFTYIGASTILRHRQVFLKDCLMPGDVVFVVDNAFKAALIHDAGGIAFVPETPFSNDDFQNFLQGKKKEDKNEEIVIPEVVVVMEPDDFVENEDEYDILSHKPQMERFCDKHKIKHISYDVFGDSLNDLDLLSKHTFRLRKTIERIKKDSFRQIDPSIASIASSEMYIHDFFSDDEDTEPLPLFPSGISVLDRALGGGIHSEYMVLGAEPGMGKTTLALQIAHNLAKAGNIVLFYSFEMRPENLISKCISRFSFEYCVAESLPYEMALESQEVLTLRSDRDALGSEKRKMYEKMGGRFSTNLCFPHGNCTLEKICSDVAFHVAQGNGRKVVVIVDYLQKMSAKGNSKREQVEAITAGLQALRIKYDIPVIALSSINKQIMSKNLELGDFKESSNIGHDADVALALQFSAVGNSKYDVNNEKKKNPRDVDILILKQRVGTTGNTIRLHYYAKWDCFMEPDGIVKERTTGKRTISKGTK